METGQLVAVGGARPPNRHSREGGNPGGVRWGARRAPPGPPSWIRGNDGVGGGTDGVWAGWLNDGVGAETMEIGANMTETGAA